MKRFLFIAALLSVSAFTTQAQAPSYTGSAVPFTSSTVTLTTTGADTLTAKMVGFYNSITLHINGTKTSGTVAGKVVTYVSGDNGVSFAPVDTVTLVDGPNIINKRFVGNPETHYRQIITVTNGISTWTGSILPR